MGGIACYNRDLLTALAANDRISAVRVLPRVGRGTYAAEKLKQLSPHQGKLAYSLTAFDQARQMRPDWILCGHLFMLPLAASIGRLFEIPVWLQLHGIDAWRSTAPWVRRAVERVNIVTCVSRHTRRCFVGWAVADPERVRVLPNTVGSEFAPGDRLRNREALGLSKRIVLLTVGRMAVKERYKGQDRVLKCLPELLRKSPRLLYVIAGGGPDRTRLERLSNDMGVAHAVRFVGQVSAEDLPKLYNAADLFVMPSTGEGFGIVYLEAMACGTPVLGLWGDGSCDPLRDGAFGTLTDEVHLGPAIEQALARGRPEGLSERVLGIFGREAFDRQVDGLLCRLQHIPGTAACAE